MAGTQGVVVVFDAYLENTWDSGIHDFGASPNTIKCAIINDTVAPTITDADPHFGGTGTTNHATNEQSGGSYTAGGLTCATATATLNAGTLEVDFGDPGGTGWAKNAANPTDIDYGIIYDDTVASKKCIGWVELGTTFDGTTGDLTIAWGAPFHTVNQT